MIGTLLINTIGQLVAPDPVYEEKEREEIQAGTKLTLSDAIGQFFAPDPAYLASKYNPDTNGSTRKTVLPGTQDGNKNVLEADVPQSQPSGVHFIPELSTPPQSSELVNESSSLSLSGDMKEDDDLDRDITERVRNLVLDSCYGTAESRASSMLDWEEAKDFFTICSSLKELNEAKKKRMGKMLKKNPNLVLARSVQLGNMVPDGFSPLHAAAYVGNLSAISILLDFVQNTKVIFSSPHKPSKYPTSQMNVNDYLNIRDNQGRTALHVSAEQGNIEATEMIRKEMNNASGKNPIGEHAPIDLCRRTPLGWALTSKNSSATKNRKKLETILFSPGDRSIYPRTPASTRCSTTKGKSSMKRPGINLSYGYSDMPGRRIDMEDAVCAFDQIGNHGDMALFGVFDGHGNKHVSDFISRHILNCLTSIDAFRSNAPVQVLKRCLSDACLNLDELLKSDLRKYSRTGGSTGVIALITPTHILVANVGDSRGIVIQRSSVLPSDENNDEAKGETSYKKPKVVVVSMSEDHTPNLPIERERIEKAGFLIETISHSGETLHKVKNPNSGSMLGMSRAFGDFDYKQNEDMPATGQAIIASPEIEILERSERDLFLVLACDGIWDVMSNQDCADFIVDQLPEETCNQPIVAACDALVERCYNLGSEDNMTVLVVSLPTPLGVGRSLDFSSD